MEVVDSDEEYLDDPIKLIDYEQYRFGMATQGFDAFKQVIPNKTQTYFLNRETLLNTVCDAHKCKPMSVQLVDCVKYHRYYKLKPKKGMGRYQLQKTLKRKTIKKVSNRKQSAGNFDKAAVNNCMDKTNFAKKFTYRCICNKTNEVSLKDVEIDTCYSPNQLNQTCRHTPLTFENKEVFDNRTEPSKLFNQNINSTGNLPVIEHVFSLNCSMVRETLNNQYGYEDKRRLRNVINLINLYRSTEKIKESQTSYNGASVECGSETAMPRFTNNVNEPELQVKENQMLDVIDIDTEDNIKPNNTTNRNGNSEKEFDNPKKIDNLSDINKYRPSRDFKGYYKKSDVIRIVPKYRSSTPLPCNYSAQSLNPGKLGVPHNQLFIPQVSRLCIQSSKPKRNLSQPNECSESVTNNKVYLPCIYLKSLKDFPEVPSVDNFGDNKVMKDRDITRNPEPDEFMNNNLYRSNVSKGYSPPILPIPAYATLLDCFSQFRSKLLYKSNGELPTLRTVLEKSKLMNM